MSSEHYLDTFTKTQKKRKKKMPSSQSNILLKPSDKETRLTFTNTCYGHINKYIIAYIHKRKETEISEIECLFF